MLTLAYKSNEHNTNTVADDILLCLHCDSQPVSTPLLWLVEKTPVLTPAPPRRAPVLNIPFLTPPRHGGQKIYNRLVLKVFPIDFTSHCFRFFFCFVFNINEKNYRPIWSLGGSPEPPQLGPQIGGSGVVHRVASPWYQRRKGYNTLSITVGDWDWQSASIDNYNEPNKTATRDWQLATGPVVAMDSEGEVLACTALVIGACMMATEVREAESGCRTKWVRNWLLEWLTQLHQPSTLHVNWLQGGFICAHKTSLLHCQ